MHSLNKEYFINQTKKSYWKEIKIALLLAVLTMIFANVFLGILVFLAIEFWVSRNEPVTPVELSTDGHESDPSYVGSSA